MTAPPFGGTPESVSTLASALLEVRDLVTHFVAPSGATVRAVDGVTLSVRQGRTLGVVGESGSGKTMLVRSIMGLLPESGVARRRDRATR